MAVALRRQLWSTALIILLGASCGDYKDPNASPTVVRAGEVYTCSNGLDGCQVTYRIGPVTQVSGKIRIDFLVTLDGPAGGTTQWTNDTDFHKLLKEQGKRGIVLTLALENRVYYELVAVGGIASIDDMLIAPVTYEGFWEFVVPEPPGSLLLLSYPDFIEAPAPVVVPE